MEATCRSVRHFRAEDLASPSASFILRCSDSFCHLQRRHLQRPSRTLLKARLRLPRGCSLSPLALQGLSCFDNVAESLSAAYISRSAHGLRSPPPAPALTLAPTLLGFCVRRGCSGPSLRVWPVCLNRCSGSPTHPLQPTCSAICAEENSALANLGCGCFFSKLSC